MRGLKSAILAIFQKSANWPDWPCPNNTALQNRPQDLFFLLTPIDQRSTLDQKESGLNLKKSRNLQ